VFRLEFEKYGVKNKPSSDGGSERQDSSSLSSSDETWRARLGRGFLGFDAEAQVEVDFFFAGGESLKEVGNFFLGESLDNGTTTLTVLFFRSISVIVFGFLAD
jgi:hypothetical protein